jgi:pimeloyl-ACP methyl ester carboxylesterase
MTMNKDMNLVAAFLLAGAGALLPGCIASGDGASDDDVTSAAADGRSDALGAAYLDTGIYWFGLGNRSQKAEVGVSNPFYDPSRPTVIYIHGWKMSSSVNGEPRETFNYAQNQPTGVNVDLADAWIRSGWNIGIFYWDQLADELEVKHAEAKIWTATGPRGMRWRKGDGSYTTAGAPRKSAAEVFADAYLSALRDQRNPNIRLAGHSLGSQMVTRGAKLVSDKVSAGEIPDTLRPKRIALLDPFWSRGGKAYLSNRWTGEVSRDYVSELISRGTIFERYKSSNINDLYLGDRNLPLTARIGDTELIPGYISNIDQAGRHNAAPNLYFHSFAFSPPPECSVDRDGNRSCGGIAASASTPDSVIRAMMGTGFTWIQTEGIRTENPGDNVFDRNRP